MPIVFNADEVVGMAVEIERNGQRFYARGAQIVSEPAVKKLMTDLVDWEKAHERLFLGLREGLTDDERVSTAFDPEGEMELYNKAMAGGHVFTQKTDASELISDDDSAADILTTALGMERDSILFYIAMKGAVPKRLGPDKVEALIREEMSHVIYLQKQLEALK
ncbi:MAG: ferritin-like domain-containing protein [Planctomycetota bacterium]|jgi:rubrerythrin